MENFKSFGKRISTPFLPGFTGIGGPNGAGKSNISDAILFVLGPKSSKVIRAGRLTDLIFDGGVTKNPADYCKVSLVFDNADKTIPVDSDDVVLTRLVKYADGSESQDYYSYFYVNGKSSSMGEFENLLAYAHISGDGYNIVQQGDVNAIINMGNVERRKILDSIAGITKFDDDIHRAEEKKTDTEGNMEKINIISEEIKTQIGNLEKEREQALKYKALKDELILRKYQQCLKKKSSFESEIEKIKSQMQSYTDEKAKTEKEIETQKSELERHEKSLNEIDKKIGDKGSEELKELKVKLDSVKTELVKATEGINYCRDELKKLKDGLAKTVIELTSTEKEVNRLLKEKKKTESELEERKEGLKKCQNEYEKVQGTISKSDTEALSTQKELVKLKKEYESLQEELNKSRAEREITFEKVQRLESELGTVEESVKTYQLEVESNKSETKEQKKEIEKKEERIAELNQKVAQLKNEEEKLQNRLKVLEPKIRRLTTQYHQMKAEQSAIEDVHKGYTKSVSAVLEARDKGILKGVHGTVAELGTVPKEYELALAIAAGGRLQSVVVETDEDAAKAIKYLSEKALGRATFLPLNKMIKGYPAGKSLMVAKDSNSLGFAINLIKFDEKYSTAFWYVFGSTIVMKNLDSARKHMGGVRLVTLNGDLLEASGAMTGGSIERFMKFGSEETELDKIAKELRDVLQEQEKIISETTSAKEEYNKMENELKSLAGEKEICITKISGLELRLKEFVVKLNDLKKSRDELESTVGKAKDALASHDAKIAKYTERISELEKQKEEKGKALLELTSERLAARSKELQENNSKLSEEIRNLTSVSQTLETQLQIVDKRKQELKEQHENIKKEIEEKENKIHSLTEDKGNYQNECDALIKVEESMGQELKGLNEKRCKVFEKVTDLKNKIDGCQTKLTTYEDMYREYYGKIPALEDKLGEMIFEMQTYTSQIAIKEGEKIPSMEDLKTKIQDCETGLQSLGLVNMKAIDDYEIQKKRKDDMETELARLDEQKKELVQVVEELQKKKKVGLVKVFDGVNENFKRVYAEMSDGNEGELILENQENPFEGGLIIRVKQTGKKKPRRLEALSGGEKSLTALAFIFAIQYYEPSPFYVLDEIDMHLDAMNADVVGRVVKKNSKATQFIIISLKKITLKEADHLYGVIKRDNGVSEIIGNINLDDIGEKGEISAPTRGG